MASPDGVPPQLQAVVLHDVPSSDAASPNGFSPQTPRRNQLSESIQHTVAALPDASDGAGHLANLPGIRARAWGVSPPALGVRGGLSGHGPGKISCGAGFWS